MCAKQKSRYNQVAQAEDRAMLGSNSSVALGQSPKPGWSEELHPDFLETDFRTGSFKASDFAKSEKSKR